MNLNVEIKSDFNGTISITDLALETSNGYVTDDNVNILTSPYNFTYELTCTLDIINYSSTSEEKLIDALYVHHISPGADSVRVPLPYDGHFIVDHIVLPTKDWLEAIYNLYKTDLTTALFGWTDSDEVYHSGFFDSYDTGGIYVVDVIKYDSSNNLLSEPLYRLYKLTLHLTDDGNIDLDDKWFTLQTIDSDSDFDTLISSTSTLEKTTVSMATYNVFSIDKLKNCFVKAAKNILDQVPKCGTISEISKFNRDFLWMTINVINIWLEKDEYDMAQVVLERLGCYNFCPDILNNSKKQDCGCSKKK